MWFEILSNQLCLNGQITGNNLTWARALDSFKTSLGFGIRLLIPWLTGRVDGVDVDGEWVVLSASSAEDLAEFSW